MSLEFEWDDDKAAENLAVHDVAFRKGALVFSILVRSKTLITGSTMAKTDLYGSESARGSC
jgi:uncharacterized DUF497 family protein